MFKFKLQWTIDGILKVFTAMHDKLDALIVQETGHWQRKSADAVDLKAEADAHLAEAKRAAIIQEKIAALIA